MSYASSSTAIEDLIGSATSIDDIIAILAKRGCKNLTSSINLAACSQMPRAGGGYCDVFEGKLNNGTAIAIKSLRVYDGPKAEMQRKKILKHAARELYHWAKLRHPNVLPLLGLSLFRGQISMISEWMDNGSLMSFLELNPDADRIGFCVDICTGLRYIHANGMAHGDLKAANVMVSSYGVAMLADFGCARLKDLTLQFTNTTSNAFSIRWAAPELLDQSDGPEDNKAADVYALGMTILEVLSGEVPFAGLQETRVMFMVAVKHEHPPRPEAIANDMWEILVSCWNPTPEGRPTITHVNNRLRGLVGPIINEMSIAQVLGHLERYGCSDIINQPDISEYTEDSALLGDPGNTHRGALLDIDPVSLRSLRLKMNPALSTTAIFTSDKQLFTDGLRNLSDIRDDTAYIVSPQYGGSDVNYGSLFNDASTLDLDPQRPISQLIITSGWVVDGMRITYRLKNGQTQTVTHGVTGYDTDTALTLDDNEYISGATGKTGIANNGEPWMGDCIHLLRLEITNSKTGAKRTYGPFGKEFRLPARATTMINWSGHLLAFAGRADNSAKQVGLRGISFVEQTSH